MSFFDLFRKLVWHGRSSAAQMLWRTVVFRKYYFHIVNFKKASGRKYKRPSRLEKYRLI